MNTYHATQQLSNMDLQIHTHSFDTASKCLQRVNQELQLTFAIPYHSDYDNAYLQKTLFYFTLSHCGDENKLMKNEAIKTIRRWSYMVASIQPFDFMNSVIEILQQQDAIPCIHQLLPAIGHAISLLGDDSLRFFKVINQIFNQVLPSHSKEIPVSMWEAVGKFAPESEIQKILTKNYDHDFAKIAYKLILKNPKDYSSILFTSAPADFLIMFLEYCPPGYDFSYTEIITRIKCVCEKKGSAGFEATCALFGKILNYNIHGFPDEQAEIIQGILKTISSYLNDVKMDSRLVHTILGALLAGSKKGYFSKEELDQINENIVSKLNLQGLHTIYLESLLFCHDLHEDKSKLHKYIMGFAPFLGQVYIDFLSIMRNNYLMLKESDSGFMVSFLWHLIHPLPIEPLSAIAVLKFLLEIDPQEILDPHVDANIDQIIEKYMSISHPELNKYVVQFAKYMNVSFTPSQIDLFGRFSDSYILLSTNINFSTVQEIIQSQVLIPQHRYSILKVLQAHPTYYMGFLNTILDVLSQIAIFLGFDVENIFWKGGNLSFTQPSEEFIREEELHDLYIHIDGPLQESDFGILVNEVLFTLEKFSIIESNMPKEVIGKIALLCGSLVSLFPSGCIRTLSKLHEIYNKNRTEDLQNNFHDAYTKIQTANLPLHYSVDIAYFGHYCYGHKQTMKQYHKHLIDAFSKNREMLDLYKTYMKQPFPPMPTFLSLSDVSEHKDWVEICQQVINPYEWVIRENDSEALNRIPNNEKTKEINKIVEDRIRALRKKPKPAGTPTNQLSWRAPAFNFQNDYKVAEGPQMHKNEKSKTLFGLISFLWHSNNPLPEGVTAEEIEEFALNNNRNPKLLAGFFSWANKNNYKINYKKWADKVYIKRYTKLWLFAFASFLSNIHCPFTDIPLPIVNQIQKCLVSFGYQILTKPALIHGYQHNHGVEWLIFRNTIAIDPDFFSDYPLVVAELTNNMDLFKKHFDELLPGQQDGLLSTFIGINSFLFEPKPEEMMYTSLVPTNHFIHSKLMTFKTISRIPVQVELPVELLESIISCFQRQKFVSYDFFAFFMNIKMNKEQFDRVHDIFFNSTGVTEWTRKVLLPSLFLFDTGKSEVLQDDAILFYSRKPPSLTRAFYRSLLCSFAPPVKQSLIKRVEDKLCEVFPELCYKGFAKNGIKIWKSATPLSKLRFGFIDSAIGASLLNDMKTPCNQALEIYKLLYSLPDDELAVAQPWATKGMIRDELARVFLEAAISEKSSISYVYEAIVVLVDTLGIENLMIHIGNKEFLSKPNFILVAFAFYRLYHIAETSNNEVVINFLKMFFDPEIDLFEDKEKEEIFRNLNNEETIGKLIYG
ncbi:hypothetical protein TRFO_12736 [Tritrichomonas foetus]|uniref:Uncharacterized protein n=1 Tax=Tritrichomonas foetus TaxID=1144522 RepID=A0A1J4L0T3_9EUKA|nr:hypothetical protein TRFO_12736 [Tritrichomonas foetus]|eukprot:OHT17034.1 hypothetical protein TRFO_12736 [Tritrichomonas foetus]